MLTTVRTITVHYPPKDGQTVMTNDHNGSVESSGIEPLYRKPDAPYLESGRQARYGT